MYTPFSAIAAVGLVKNQGLMISANLISSVSSFGNLELTQASQGCLVSTGGQTAAVLQALKQVPGFLTGIVANISQFTADSALTSTINSNNIVANIAEQANTVFGTGPRYFTNTIKRAKTFAENSYDFYALSDTITSSNLDSYGFTINNYQDVLTTGVTSQFPAAGSTSQGFLSFLDRLSNFGTMYDVNFPSEIHRPYVLCINLLNQGFSIVGQVLIDQAVDINAIDIVSDNKILLALSNITGAELKTIVTLTNFQPYQELTNLSEVFDNSKVFSPVELRVAGGSLSALANKLLNIGGKYSSFSDLSNFLRSIKTDVNTAVFDQLSQTDKGNIVSGLTSSLGSGSGIYGNPVISDILGCVSGTGYASNVALLSAYQTQILATTQGQTLKNAILDAYDLDPGDTQGLAAANVIIQSTTDLLSSQSQVVQAANIVFNGLCARFVQERVNYLLISSEIQDLDVSNDSIYNFAQELATLHLDPKGTGQYNFVRSIVDPSIYGQAILAAITEGYNTYQAEQRGVLVPTKF